MNPRGRQNTTGAGKMKATAAKLGDDAVNRLAVVD
jgi:hypothetical protein